MKHIILIISAIAISIQVNACDCPKPNAEERYKSADIVATGTVIRAYWYDFHYSIDSWEEDIGVQRAIIVLSKVYKGALISDTVEFTTGFFNCDYEFEQGASYILFASYSTPWHEDLPVSYQMLYTSTCSPTQLKTRKAVKKIEKIAASQ